MSGANATVPGTKGRSTLVRATFEAGMLLQHEDMERLQAYPAELSRLLMRSLFGCGVVCGLVVRVKPDCGKLYVTVSSGLGLDCAGDPIHVPTDQSFALDDECNADLPAELWVILCGTVKRCAPRPSMCGSDDDDPPIRTRERDGFDIRVRPNPPPPCLCGCLDDMTEYTEPAEDSKCQCVDPKHPCYRDHYAGKCGCHCDECSDCTGKCIVLARLKRVTSKTSGLDYTFKPEHSVRRFIRPVLIRDPQIALDKESDSSTTVEETDTHEESATELMALGMQEGGKEKTKSKAARAPKAKSSAQPDA